MCGILASCVCPRKAHVPTNDSTDHPNGELHTNREALSRALQQGIDRIKHRGPDGSRVWVSQDGRIGLAHCRLSINDLSSKGAQPLHSDDGEIHAVVNGEIYDHVRLRDVCATRYGYRFSSESDSELVIALYKIYGSPGLFEHLRGEFAFVLYDERAGFKRVVAGRDRFGIKPLLWTIVKGRVLFAAEAKAFSSMGWEPEWDVRGITDCGWLFDDRTIFKGVRKLLPGHWLQVTEEHGLQIQRYWDAEYPDKTKVEDRTIDEMVLGVRERLVDAVRLRLRADVPVGIYLSGGIDSSAIAGIVTDLARKQNVQVGNEHTSSISCFSIRFGPETGYDETDFADRTAKWLGVRCFKLNVDEQKLAENFAEAAYHCEHHHFDLNYVAKFCLSDFTRQHGIKVVLTGEGSDEHFCGYPNFATNYLREPDLAMPQSILAANNELREALCNSAHAETNAVWCSQVRDLETAPSPSTVDESTMLDSLIAWQPPKHVYEAWIHHQYEEEWDSRKTLLDVHSDQVRSKLASKWHPGNSAMYLWNESILTNVILACLGDRTEMAHSIEGRTPFLDHHLVEYVNALPPSIKVKYTAPEGDSQDARSVGSALQKLTEKWVLREAARPYLTDELYNRKKVPFWAPTKWPKDGPLDRMFRVLLTREAVENLGFVRYDVVERALDAAFGEHADAASFRLVCYTGGWVAMSQQLGVRKATA